MHILICLHQKLIRLYRLIGTFVTNKTSMMCNNYITIIIQAFNNKKFRRLSMLCTDNDFDITKICNFFRLFYICIIYYLLVIII